MRDTEKDFSGYQYEGTYNWREAIEIGKGSGVLTVSPCPEMLRPEGYTRKVGNKNSQTYIECIYDEGFVRDFLHKKIMLGVGFMIGDTVKADEYLEFMKKQIDYSLQEKKRSGEGKLIKHAQELAKENGNTVEFWLNILKQGLAAREKEQELVPNKSSSNSTTREKVKA